MSYLLIERMGIWWLTALTHFLWQGTFIWLLAAIAMRCLRRHRSSVRYLVLCGALCAMVGCLAVTLSLSPMPTADEVVSTETARPTKSIDSESAVINATSSMPKTTNTNLEQASNNLASLSPSTAIQDRGHRDSNNRANVDDGNKKSVANERNRIAQSSVDQTSSSSQSAATHGDANHQWWIVLTIVAYAVCVVLMLGRVTVGLAGGLGLRHAARLVNSSELLNLAATRSRELGLKWTPAVAWCEQVAVPTMVGLLRPMILLPASLSTGLTPEQLSTILAHELAHIRRFDHIVNLFQRLVEALLFFHPAVWSLSRWMRLEREHCCDDLVVELEGSRLLYVDSLLRVAELSYGSATPSNATSSLLLSATGRPSQLAGRIVRLLEGPEQPPLRLSRGASVLFVLFPCLILLSPLWLQTLAQPDSESRSAKPHPETAQPSDTETARRDQPVENASPTIDAADKPLAKPPTPQVFFWSMIVDETIAEKLSEMDETKLPGQAAFRVIGLDSDKLRKTLFGSNLGRHIVSDVSGIRPLYIASDSISKYDISGTSSFNISHSASATGSFSGEYIAQPGQPFDLRIDEAKLNITFLTRRGNEEYAIKPQPLEFKGDLPIGRAIVFTAKATAKTGDKSLYPLYIFETLPQGFQ